MQTHHTTGCKRNLRTEHNLKKTGVTMRLLLSVLAVLWILQIAALTDAVPNRYYEEDDDKALYDPNLFEGDIEITQEQFERFYDQPQNGKSGTVSMWESHIRLWVHSVLHAD